MRVDMTPRFFVAIQIGAQANGGHGHNGKRHLVASEIHTQLRTRNHKQRNHINKCSGQALDHLGIERIRIAARHRHAHSRRHKITERDRDTRKRNNVVISNTEAQHHQEHRQTGDACVANNQIGNEMNKQIDGSVEQEKPLLKARNTGKAKGFSHSSTQQGAHQ